FDDIHIHSGDVILLEGKNGTGKTTFLRYAAGLNGGWPAGAFFRGQDVSVEAPQYPDDIGFVPDSPMTAAFEGVVRRYMAFFVEKSLQNIEQTRQTFDHFLDLIQAFGISPDAFVADLSYGQQKLLSLARCANCPALLFVDEMPISVDQQQQQLLNAFLAVLRDRGTSIVFTTHSSHLFGSAFNRQLVISDGWLHEKTV
ncbi:MAG: ATP-binding cassette domain-containing protein, partial [Spirochaetales bacterium]|nr:ATP-binding cassette domain-containing protein [Spirochaetales bacterium]